jgi:hypothetical protein
MRATILGGLCSALELEGVMSRINSNEHVHIWHHFTVWHIDSLE